MLVFVGGIGHNARIRGSVVAPVNLDAVSGNGSESCDHGVVCLVLVLERRRGVLSCSNLYVLADICSVDVLSDRVQRFKPYVGLVIGCSYQRGKRVVANLYSTVFDRIVYGATM